MRSCSVVIRAFNEEKHIERLLTGIRQQSVRGVEVILVDSGSTDRTVEIAAQHGVKVLHIEPEAFTFGRSLNLGIREAQGEAVAIASAHVYPVYPDWLERLTAPFSDPEVALTYGKQRGGPETRFSERQVFTQWYPERSQPRQAHPFCNNANAAIRRSLWEQRPYNEGLTGLEDLEWAHWAVEQGQAIAYIAEAEVVHVHDESPRMVHNRYKREAMAFKRIFPEERFGWWDFVRLAGGNIASDLLRAAGQGELRRNLGSILWFRTMQFWGTFQGYRRSGPLTWQLRKAFYYPQSRDDREPEERRNVEPIRY